MKTYVIAEAGVNHNGDVQKAFELIDIAVECGADAIKFQTFKAENLLTGTAEKAQYQKQNDPTAETQYEMLRRLELSYEDFEALSANCSQRGIDFLSTPFDLDSIDFLLTIPMRFWKIPSGEITNYPYLKKLAQSHRNIILSTGMATLQEVGEAIEVLQTSGAGEITLLQCNTDYPTQARDVNLQAMKTLGDTFGFPVGYSDHTQGIDIAIAAVAMGARVLEKHFTSSRTLPGPDHKASLEPNELGMLIQAVRRVEDAMGSGEKYPSLSEQKNIPVARKSIVAKTDIAKGDTFTEENITVKRPGTGISPMCWPRVLGKSAPRDFLRDEQIDL